LIKDKPCNLQDSNSCGNLSETIYGLCNKCWTNHQNSMNMVRCKNADDPDDDTAYFANPETMELLWAVKISKHEKKES
jgi:hypothetical protein